MRKVEITGLNTSELPKLTGKECDALMRKIRDGDTGAREKFLKANMRLVLSIVGRFAHTQENCDDLFQVGCVGLLKALDNFDFSLGVRFSTYAVPMIIGEIKRFLRDRTSIKVSRNIRDTAYKALKAREKLLESSQSHDPSIFEIAKELDIDVKEIACALDAVSEPLYIFDNVYSDDEDGMTLLDQLADEKNTTENWTENLALKEALKEIPEREKNVLMLRYFYGKTQVEISNATGISQAQVSRLEKNAVEKLRKQLA
ncbi:MAG: SigB/SigF/SigG family RNA polymerase sigma factor [Clostridiales bacterium]|nr:SigB/SigF/SigG family RNA polymerase sigma factor [Clostridiales bacterium]